MILKKLLRALGRGIAPSPAAARAAPGPLQEAGSALVEPAALAYRQGGVDEAIVLLDALIEAHPECAEAHLFLGTLMHERGLYDDARDSYLLASAYERHWWTPQFRLGLLALDQERFTDALPPLARALELGADDAGVYNAFGAACLHAGRIDEAVENFNKALERNPDHVHAHSNLGYLLIRDLERYDEGASHIERAHALAPNDTSIACNLILALHHAARWDEAIALAERLLERDPALAEAQANRALILLAKGDFSGGWSGYEARKVSSHIKCVSDVQSAEWQGSPLEGHSIFVYPEQGLGDEIMFSSCIPDLAARAGRCTLECHPKLAGIFRRSFPGVEVLAKDTWRRMPQHAARSWDFKVAIGSLPGFFRRTRAEFPTHGGYLRADAARVAHWKAKLAELPGRLKVGISWRGGLASTRRSLRSIPLQQWVPLLETPDIDFVSLQYSDPHAEIEALRGDAGITLHQWAEAIDDYEETAALVVALDLVVSVQTAIVHLAGALGRPVRALMPAAPEWRYGLEGSVMPWYPAVRLIRQAEKGAWGSVLEQVRAEVALSEGARPK